MNQRLMQWLGVMAVVVVVVAAPAVAQAGTSSDNLLDLAAKNGPSLGFGLGVSPLHTDLVPPIESAPGSVAAESRMLGDREPAGRAVSFDIKLRWPTAQLPIEPYIVLGPALLVDQSHELYSLGGPASDPVLRLGAKAGAGFNWRLTRDATLFGSYDVTTSAADRFSPLGSRGAAASSATGYDLLYGLRLRY
jgi:hypothetical protein